MKRKFYFNIKKKNFTVFSIIFLLMIAMFTCMLKVESIKALPVTQNTLKVTVENANVMIDFSEDGKFHYEYNRSLYIVKRKKKGSNMVINVKERDSSKGQKEDDLFVRIFIPDQSYHKVTGISKNGGLFIPSVNANITIKNYSSAVALSLPSGFYKSVDYMGKNGSGSININDDNSFKIHVDIRDTALSTFWGGNSNGEAIYKYQQGSRKKRAKIKLNLKGCAFSIEKQ